MSGADHIETRLKALREGPPRLSQAALAEALGVTRQTIIAIETGRYAPSLDLALRIARYFERPLEEIFSLKE